MREMPKTKTMPPLTKEEIEAIQSRSESSDSHSLYSVLFVSLVHWVAATGFAVMKGTGETYRRKMKVVIANLILFPWLFLVHRWKLIASFRTPLTASVTAKFLVRLRTAIRTNVGTPIANKAVGNDRTLFQIALELGVPTLNKAVRRKTGRTEAATRSFPKVEALETFSSCLVRKSPFR